MTADTRPWKHVPAAATAENGRKKTAGLSGAVAASSKVCSAPAPTVGQGAQRVNPPHAATPTLSSRAEGEGSTSSLRHRPISEPAAQQTLQPPNNPSTAHQSRTHRLTASPLHPDSTAPFGKGGRRSRSERRGDLLFACHPFDATTKTHAHPQTQARNLLPACNTHRSDSPQCDRRSSREQPRDRTPIPNPPPHRCTQAAQPPLKKGAVGRAASGGGICALPATHSTPQQNSLSSRAAGEGPAISFRHCTI